MPSVKWLAKLNNALMWRKTTHPESQWTLEQQDDFWGYGDVWIEKWLDSPKCVSTLETSKQIDWNHAILKEIIYAMGGSEMELTAQALAKIGKTVIIRKNNDWIIK